MRFFDTHAHYDDSRFDEDRESLLANFPQEQVALVVNPGCDLPSSRQALSFAHQYSHVYAAVGFHPENCGDCTDADFETLHALSMEEKVVAIGEIGLDYYWEENPSREFQQEVFRRQIELALQRDLPVIIHDREAHGDTMDILREYPQLRGVLHCFSGSEEMAKELLKRGWYLGFDGPITYKNAKKAAEVLSVTPLDRILLETDSPYLTPVPHRGHRNDSRNLVYIAEKIAEWKGLTTEEVAEASFQNGLRLFQIHI